MIGGDRTQSFNLLKNLAKNHEVHLVSNAENGPLSGEQKNKVSSLGIFVHEVHFNKWRAVLRSVSLIFSQKPLEVTFYNSPKIRKVVQNLFNEIKPDVVISFSIRTAESAVKLSCKKILLANDCRLLYQSRSAKESNSSIQKIVRLFEIQKLKKYEPEIFSKFDLVTFVTKIDLENAQLNAPKMNGEVLTCGVDLDEFKPNKKPREKVMLFAGKLDVFANTMMAQKVAQKIFPLVAKKIDELSCEIVGGCPPKSILNLASKKIKIIKDVPSLVPYFQNAGVFVHPLAGSSGIQNKLLEAMACGCPIITTPLGTQGIPIKHGVGAYIAKNDEEMVSYSVELLNNKEKAIAMGEAARKLMEQNFSWKIISEKMEEILSKTVFPNKV